MGTSCRPPSTACASWRPSTVRPWCPVSWAAPCPLTGTGPLPACEGGHRVWGIPFAPVWCPAPPAPTCRCSAPPCREPVRPQTLGRVGDTPALRALSRAVLSTSPGLSPAGQHHCLWADPGHGSHFEPGKGPVPHVTLPAPERLPVPRPASILPPLCSSLSRWPLLWSQGPLVLPFFAVSIMGGGLLYLGYPMLLHKLPGCHLAVRMEVHLG